jgi:hypothetical protein
MAERLRIVRHASAGPLAPGLRLARVAVEREVIAEHVGRDEVVPGVKPAAVLGQDLA